MEPQIVIEHVSAGRNGHATLTAKLGDNVLAVEKIDLTKPKQRERFAAAVCKDRPGIAREVIDAELLELAARSTERSVQPEPTPIGNVFAQSEDRLAVMPEQVRSEAHAMLQSPDLLLRIREDIRAAGVVGEGELMMTLFLCGVSRIGEKPMSMIVQGQSSSGKSYAVERAAVLFPAETLIVAHQMTPQALFHFEPGSLSHRWIVAGERSRLENDDTAEAKRALREMQSSGKLCKLMPVKGSDGKIVTQRIEQDGPIAYVETTTHSILFNEDENRCLLYTTDERPEQTERIVKGLAKMYTGGGPGGACQQVIDRHHALQRMLRPMPVVVPFAESLADLFPTDRVEVRRAFPLLISAVQASALLHQFQRQIDDDGRLLAHEDDYHLVRHLLAKPMARSLGGGLSEPARRFFDRLKTWAVDTFTTTEAKQHEKNSDRACYGWLVDCQRSGLVEVIEPGRGPKPAKWKIVENAPDPSECAALPAMEDVFPELANTLASKA